MDWFSKKSRKDKQPSAYQLQNNFDDLFAELIRRKHWRKINREILKGIFENAEGNVETIKTFIFISELYDLVENNFVELARDELSVHAKTVLPLWALTLYRLGSDLLKARYSAEEDKEIERLVLAADAAFTSSILCEPFFLESYAGEVLLYGTIWVNKEAALEFCAKYKEAEDKLLNTPDEALSPFHLSVKKGLNPEKAQQEVGEIVEFAPHLLPNRYEGPWNSMRDMVNELEQKLLQS